MFDNEKLSLLVCFSKSPYASAYSEIGGKASLDEFIRGKMSVYY